MNRIGVLVFLFGFATGTDWAPASELAETLESSEIGAIVQQGIEAGEMPGAVILIGYQDQVVFHHAYGHRQLKPTVEPMTKDTLFDLASLTKPIATATSVMILMQRGEIALSDPVSEHLPAFANHGKESITIEQLMLHIGGMIPDNGLSDYANGVDESIQNLMQLSPVYEPGEKFRYSDVGFQVLGELVRNKSGHDIHQFSQQAIFVPLGMTETGYLPGSELRQRAAPTEQREGHWMRGEVHDPRAYAMGGIAGHAGLFSTAADLSIYARMLLGQGRLDEVQILQPETFRRMTAAYTVPGGIRGLGWDKKSGFSSNRGQSMSPAAIGHGGFTGTAIWIDPILELYVIFLSNRLHPDGKGSVNSLAGEIGTIAADAVLEMR